MGIKNINMNEKELERISAKIEVLELLAVKLRSNKLYRDAKKIEESISVIKQIKEFYSSGELNREVDKIYISSIADYIRDNSRVDEAILAQRFTI